MSNGKIENPGGLRVIRNLFFAGPALTVRGAQAAIIVILITKGLGTQSYGTWVQVIATVSLLGPTLTLGLERVLTRYLPELFNAKAQAKLFLSLLIIVLALNISFALVLYLVSPFFASFIAADVSKVPVIAGLIGFTLVGINTNTLVSEFYRGQLRIRAHAFLWIGRDIGWIAIVFFLVSNDFSIEQIVLAFSVWLVFVSAIGLMGMLATVGWPGISYDNLKEHLRYGLPIAFAHPLGWLSKFGSFYFISIILGTAAVGVYGSIRTISESLVLISGVMLLVLSPTMARLYSMGEIEQVRRYMGLAVYGFVTFSLPLAILGTIYAEQLLRVVTNEEIINEGVSVVPYLFFGMVILGIYGILSEVIPLTKRTWRHFVITGTMSLVQVPVNLLLLPAIGLRGSAIAEVAAYSVGTIVCLFWCWKNLGLNLEKTKLIKVIFSSFLALLSAYWIPREGAGLLLGVFVFGLTYLGSAVLIGGIPPRLIKSYAIAMVRATKI